MIKRELLAESPSSARYIALHVVTGLIKLCANIATVFMIAYFIRMVFENEPVGSAHILPRFFVIALCGVVRYICTLSASKLSHAASADAKKVLRHKLYEKLTRLGPGYHEHVPTSEVVQVAVEGIDQLETYFGRYLPQFFYAMLAPLVLFIVFSFLSLKAGVVLFVCLPLIPVSIVLVQKLARDLLRRYWGRYTRLGDTFLENVQGLTTLKIYDADEEKHKDMNEKAEEFRFVTMKVLTMQLNSIIIMDVIAYGGAALGIILALSEVLSGAIGVYEAFIIIMLSAEFFLPMRTLGSYFHVAMNGMAASDKLFAILRLDEEEEGTKEIEEQSDIVFSDVTFSYDGEGNALSEVSFTIPYGQITAIVGESGSGKSTIAALITGIQKGYTGSLLLGCSEAFELTNQSLREFITYVGSMPHLFAGTVRENLLMADPLASEEDMHRVLVATGIDEFLLKHGGLDFKVMADGVNLSGGQKQRIALARALLHDTPFYIFDEATSNIDVETEADIMEAIYAFKGKKTVLLITHRLQNAICADQIHVLDEGRLVQSGRHDDLVASAGKYAELFSAQALFEQYALRGGATA